MSLVRYRVEVAGLVGGPGLSTFYHDTALGSGLVQDFCDSVEDYVNGMKAITSSTITWTGQTIADTIDRADGRTLSQEPVTGFTISGTDAATPMAPTTQGLIRMNTGAFVSGRQVIGHTYWPAPTEAVNDTPGKPSTGYVAGAQAQAQAMLDSDVGWVVYSRKNHASYPVTQVTCWSKWAVLRGRRDG